MKESILFLSFCLIFLSEINGKIIESPIVTDWGRYYSWEKCPENQFVHGFRLRTEKEQGPFGDDTANNGIILYCDYLGGSSTFRPITSGSENWGQWGQNYFCGGPVTGLQFRSEKDQGPFLDDSAANNLRLFCNGDRNRHVEGDGLWFGDWTAPQYCDNGQAVCAIQTQVEPDAVRVDQTALNNIRLECCPITSPAQQCSPSDNWELLTVCDNTKSDSPRDCAFEKRAGVSYSNEIHRERPFAPLVYKELGFTFDSELPILKNKFLTKLGKSGITETDWNSTKDNIWTEEIVNNNRMMITADPFTRLEIYQAVGNCGSYSVRSHNFKQIQKFSGKKNFAEKITLFKV